MPSPRCRAPAGPPRGTWTCPSWGSAGRPGGDRRGRGRRRRAGPYTKSATEAAGLVAAASDDADAAFLLEPTPVASILAVARDGDVMPQKSTYFYPKALTGLVLNPHEW